ncbi:MAG: hypothetical protein Q8O94_02780 [bacterium]|nr:hypothetical protein [bacterium]
MRRRNSEKQIFFSTIKEFIEGGGVERLRGAGGSLVRPSKITEYADFIRDHDSYTDNKATLIMDSIADVLSASFYYGGPNQFYAVTIPGYNRYHYRYHRATNEDARKFIFDLSLEYKLVPYNKLREYFRRK